MWELTPLDQGGRFVQLQVIGSERDEDIVRAVRRPGFFAPWGDPIRWDSLEKTELEKSVWLNRWYFLPSLANMYHRTGDKAYLGEIMSFVRKWRDENPMPVAFTSRGRNWRDMQVAWRLQNLAWSYFLGIDGFTNDEKRELYQIVDTHAGALMEDYGKQPLNENNHQSHGASAMLYAALLFPEVRSAQALRMKAFEIIEHHLAHSFYADGNSVELCPGYYLFFASIFRDAYLLCRANGIEPPRGSEYRLPQFYRYILNVAQPDSTMPPINDSSESNASVSTRVLADLLGEPPSTQPPASFYLDASQQAVMRDNNPASQAYAFLDAGPRVSAHWHSGKLGFHLWYWDRPLLVDSGINNYDDPLRRTWYNRAEAHNTILVDGAGDYDRRSTRLADRPEAGSRIEHWESNHRYDWAVMVHDGLAKGVTWTRHFVMLKGKCCIIVDRLHSSAEHDYTWLFHLPPGSPKTDIDRGKVFTNFSEKNLLLMSAQAGASRLELRNGTISRKAKNMPAAVAAYGLRGTDVVQSYLLLPVRGAEEPKAVLQQRVHGESVLLHLSVPGTEAEVEIRERTVTGKSAYELRLDGEQR
ncbi:MAG: alginate lyase family protein [Opitutaceae bacterium]|nr:alginate lyase family protein [Opitutaceae bacterium]